MALLETLGLRGDSMVIPTTVKQRISRGREAMKRDASKRRLCMRFERGDTYWYVNSKGFLSFQNTVTNPDGSGKPPHRIRNSYNLIRPIVQGKVSTATQRIPSYQVVPSTLDQKRVNAADISQKVARAGYEEWGVSRCRVRAANFAIGGGGEGFALPYFDPNVGPYAEVTDPDTGETRLVGQGEIKLRVYNGNECYWEPGSLFDESRWWAVEQAVPIEDIQEMPGFTGAKLTPDASTSDIPTDRQPSDQMVMKTEYFERPCPKYPDGRRLVIACGEQVVPEEPYPLRNADGEVLDEPVIHRLAWDPDAGVDRDFGLTWQLIDCERTIQDALNKISEWKNRCLHPQMLVHMDALVNRRTDEPGADVVWKGVNEPKWETPPPVPDSLFRIVDTMQQIMRQIASDDASELQADLSNVAAKTLQAAVEQALNRWQAFIAGLAKWDAAVMRHCLLLAARHYTEPRLLKIGGRDSWSRIPDFQGADLMGEVDVRVFPDSLVPLTRQGVQDQLTWLAGTFPGWLNPQDALAALQTASLDRLTQSYWLDVARANDIIEQIRDGTVQDMPPRGTTNPLTNQPNIDPATGQQLEVPGYMPTAQDNLQVWEKVFGDWMKTDDFGRQSAEAQDITQQIWDAIEQMQVMKAQKQAQMQTAMAESQGLQNAAKPQGAKPAPSAPGSDQAPPPAP